MAMEVREILRLVNLRFDGTGLRVGMAAPRRVLGVAMAWGALAAVGMGQLAVPRYQSPIEAPKPQMPAIPLPTAVTVNGTVVEFPIVRVNDQLIDRSDYERASQQLIDDARRMNPPLTAEELAQEQKDLLRDMIDQQLLLSRGKELDINADADVIRQLDEIRKQNKLDSMEELEKAVREQGLDYEDFKEGIKDRIITQQVVGQEVGRRLTLTAKEEQAYYDAHKQDFPVPEQVRLSEILVPVAADATDDQVQQGKAKADDVEAQLKAGTKFEDLAKQYTGGQTLDSSGDLGEFKRGQLAQVLEDQTFGLKAGEFTAPIRTRQGYVVLKVTEHSAEGTQPLSAVDDLVKEAIYQEAIKPALRTYLTGLREKAYIDVAPGFVDTGASPKETKPVFTTYTAPTPKKKVAKERLEGTTAASGAGSAVAKSTAKAGKAGVTAAAGSGTAAVKPVSAKSGKKPKKIRREKVRFGQAPRKSLPAGPEETAMSGQNLGAGGTAAEELASDTAPGTAIAPIDQTATGGVTTTADAGADPLAPKAPERAKTRFSQRAPVEAKVKAKTKVAKAEAKVADATPVPLTADQKAAQQVQSAPLGLNGDTAKKKKKAKVKGAAKERIQAQPPAPPAAKPDATPIPPKSVRENGEPVVTPAPDPSTLPAVAPATP
jgi:peptidyl-prolyl cis-trans isomerase SurA